MHEEKKKDSELKGNFDLGKYYEKELKGLIKTKERKKKQLNNSK